MTVSRSGPENTVLIAIMNNQRDFAILRNEGWYRIPVKTAPSNLKEGIVKYIAFYHTAEFKDEKFSIRFYAPIERIIKVTGYDLFPAEVANTLKTNKEYYKIEINGLKTIVRPIFSQRPRRINFIPTSEEKFFGTMELHKPEINYLFNASPLEDILFRKFVDNKLFPEREYMLDTGNKTYYLDFAAFCKTSNLDIECDGDHYHNFPQQVQKDKIRNNALANKGWHVLRYTTAQLTNDFENTWREISSTIVRFGGIQNPLHLDDYRYPPDATGQGRLWD